MGQLWRGHPTVDSNSTFISQFMTYVHTYQGASVNNGRRAQERRRQIMLWIEAGFGIWSPSIKDGRKS
jgi:hypothetical protein